MKAFWTVTSFVLLILVHSGSTNEIYSCGGVIINPAYGTSPYAPSPSAYVPSTPNVGAGAPSYGPSAPTYGPLTPAYGSGVPAYGSVAPSYGSGAPPNVPGHPTYGLGAPNGQGTPIYRIGNPKSDSSAPAYGPGASAYGAPVPAPSGPSFAPLAAIYTPSNGAYPVVPRPLELKVYSAPTSNAAPNPASQFNYAPAPSSQPPSSKSNQYAPAYSTPAPNFFSPTSSYEPTVVAPDGSPNSAPGLSFLQQAPLYSNQAAVPTNPAAIPFASKGYPQHPSNRKYVPEDRLAFGHRQEPLNGQPQKEIPHVIEEILFTHDEPLIKLKPKCPFATKTYLSSNPNGYSDEPGKPNLEALERLKLVKDIEDAIERARNPYGLHDDFAPMLPARDPYFPHGQGIASPSLPYVPASPYVPYSPYAPASAYAPSSPLGPASPYAPTSPYAPASPYAPVSPYTSASPYVPASPYAPALPYQSTLPYNPSSPYSPTPFSPNGPPYPYDPNNPPSPYGPAAYAPYYLPGPYSPTSPYNQSPSDDNSSRPQGLKGNKPNKNFGKKIKGKPGYGDDHGNKDDSYENCACSCKY